jgi:hypothetical protein
VNYIQSQQDAAQTKEQLLERRREIESEKERLDRENGEIERQLIGLERVLEGLEFLSNGTPSEIDEPGFTTQIRRILLRTRIPLTAVEIRDALLETGVKYSSAKTLLISIHTVLGRLKSDLKESQKDGKTAYKFEVRIRPRQVFPGTNSRPAAGDTSLTSFSILDAPNQGT